MRDKIVMSIYVKSTIDDAAYSCIKLFDIIYFSKGLMANIKVGSKVNTKIIANSIAIPVKTPK